MGRRPGKPGKTKKEGVGLKNRRVGRKKKKKKKGVERGPFNRVRGGKELTLERDV